MKQLALRRLNHGLRQAAVVGLVWILATVHWLIGTITGVLVLAVTVWNYVRWKGTITPFKSEDLLRWFIAQRGEVKLALAAMLLTLIGFMVAFWTASLTWARQKELELRLDAAQAIHARFQSVTRLLNSLDSYLYILRKSISEAEKATPGSMAASHLGFVNSRADAFAKDRQDLYAAMLDVYALNAEFAVVIANVIGVSRDIQRASRAIEHAQEKIGLVRAPHVETKDPNFDQAFLAQCDNLTLQAAQEECARAREDSTLLSGKASGKLTAGVIRPNLLALLSFTRNSNVIGKLLRIRKLD